MTILNVFKQDPFTAMEMTAAVEKVPYQPQALGALGIFDPNPIRTTALAVEERQGVLTVVPTSKRGEAPKQRTTEKRKMRYFEVPRLAFADTIYASELQNVREFGTESVLMQVQTEVARRLSGPTGLTKSLEFTWERHRLGALQGQLLDADGSVIYNWFDEFGITPNATVFFNLAAKTASTLRPICADVVRLMARKSQGAFSDSTKVYGLCGDDFWDLLVTHPDVEKTFINWQQAAELRGGIAFEAMYFGGIYWFNYRGSDDDSTIKIANDAVKFFPVNAPGVFEVAYAPGESAEWINTPGKPQYILPIFDRDRNFWWSMELYSYPLFICKRPEVLVSGDADAS